MDRFQRGSILVLTAVMLPVILLFCGLALDMGELYAHRARLQNAADAAALAGPSAGSSLDAMNTLAKKYALLNEEGNEEHISFTGSLPQSDVYRVELTEDLTTNFAGALGLDLASQQLKVTASAKIASGGVLFSGNCVGEGSGSDANATYYNTLNGLITTPWCEGSGSSSSGTKIPSGANNVFGSGKAYDAWQAEHHVNFFYWPNNLAYYANATFAYISPAADYSITSAAMDNFISQFSNTDDATKTIHIEYNPNIQVQLDMSDSHSVLYSENNRRAITISNTSASTGTPKTVYILGDKVNTDAKNYLQRIYIGQTTKNQAPILIIYMGGPKPVEHAAYLYILANDKNAYLNAIIYAPYANVQFADASSSSSNHLDFHGTVIAKNVFIGPSDITGAKDGYQLKNSTFTYADYVSSFPGLSTALAYLNYGAANSGSGGNAALIAE